MAESSGRRALALVRLCQHGKAIKDKFLVYTMEANIHTQHLFSWLSDFSYLKQIMS